MSNQNIDYKELKEILKYINDANITEFKLELADFKIEIKKGSTVPLQTIMAAAPQVVHAAPVAHAAPAAAAEPALKASNDDKYLKVVSPMVGTFYASPAPGAKPFAQLGDTVKPGQTVCIIEAMKLMNDISSEVSGRVAQILVQDGQAVEYGQVLMLIEP